jgi:Spy/CpxP family protein refolding chaperone
VISMKKTTIVGLGLILVLALVATVALAWGPGFGPGFGRGFGGPAYGSPPIPTVTAEQSAQIQVLRDGFLKEIEPLQKELYAKGQEFRNLWQRPNPDQAAISAKQKEISISVSNAGKGTSLGLEIRKVLTPEQLAQLPAFNQGGMALCRFRPAWVWSPNGYDGPMGRW